MEHTIKMLNKDTILIYGLAYILLIGQSFSLVCAEELQLPKDLTISEYSVLYGSVQGSGMDWQALHDPNSNPVLVACLKGATDESLKLLGITDLQQRLERLERGNLIRKAGERYTLAFPAVVGDKRDQLQRYAEQAALQLVPSGEKMVAQIRSHLAGRDEMIYHVLWSVVMDGSPAWNAARAEMDKKIDAGDTSIENKVWFLYPPHPFRVGTNGYNTSCGHLQITWSRNSPNPNVIGSLISKYINQLSQAIEQDSAVESAEAKDALGKYGLVDGAGKVRFYTVQSDSDTAAVYMKLGTEFGRQMMAYLDVKKVAEMLEVSPGIAFVIAYHEICWQLLQKLAEKNVLSVPHIVAQAGTETSNAYQLVSLVITQSVKRSLPETEMSAEEAQAIEEYRRIKARILAGDSYDDTSTPLHAALTHFSTLGQGQTRDYFMGLDILRAPPPPAKPEEGSLWPVFAGDTELADTFILAYSKGQWIWIGNMGGNYDWRIAKSTFEKWAQEKIKESAPSEDSSAQRASEAPTPGKSIVNRALSLDGEADYVCVADSQSLRSFKNAITIEVWFKVSSFYAEDGAVNSIIRKNIAPNVENFFLRFRNVAGKPAVEMSIGYDIETLRAPYEFAVGTWYHVAGTYDGSAMAFFVNGVSIKSQKVSGPLYIDQSDLFIGRGDPEFSFGEYFHGALDEIRIWNVARSPEEIQAAMKSPLTGKEEGLVAYWNFDDGTAKDLSGHGNDGILNGDAQIVESPHPALLALQERKPNKLVAWWKLDEADGNDVADSSGNGRVGRLVGNPQWRPAGGKVGGALEFDGNGDYIEVSNESAFDITGAITVAAWIKVNRFEKRWQTIVAKGDSAWRLQRTAGEDTIAFHCTGIESISGEWPHGIEGKKSAYDGKWHHVVGVYDGFTVSLYIDGVLDNLSQASGAIQTNDFAVNIGDNCEQINREWNGLIDEVCVIAGAIDANGIHALYSGEDPMTIAEQATTVAPAQASETQLQDRNKLVAWWKFENDANDSAGVNHGTVHGNPTYVAGKVGQAISLDGDDYVDCGNPSSLNFGTGDWAVSAWIKTTQSGTDDANEPNRGTVFANGGDEAGGIRYTLAVNEEQSGMITLTTDDDLSKVQAISTTAVNDGAWHHVVGTRHERQLCIYVDGVLKGTNTLPYGFSLAGTSQQNAYVGVITDNRDNSLYKYFVGLIDEVCIFACALDADSVSALYSGRDPMTVAKEATTSEPTPLSGKSNMATTLILVLGLAGVIGAIILFLVKSSIR